MTIKAQKSSMRGRIIARVSALDPATRVEQESRLAERLVDLFGFEQATTVLLFASAFADEVDTGPMFGRALDAGKRLTLPRVNLKRRTLELCAVRNLENDLIMGHRTILEPGPGCPLVSPSEIDWALVPGVGFDRQGYRLGRGGGYYDRLLPTLRPDVGCWALILDAQWVDQIPREPHDRRLTGVADHREIWIASTGAPSV